MSVISIDNRNALLGQWTRQDLDAGFATTFAFQAVEDEMQAVRDAAHIFLPHPLLPTLWSAPGVHRHVYLTERTLWVRNHWRAAWQPYCRPGLDQLLDPDAPPELRYDRETLISRVGCDGRVREIEFRDECVNGRDRCIVRIWRAGYGELRAWDDNGLFDLCELL